MPFNNGSETAVYALGGLGEVGKNTYCIEHDDTLVIIDAGVMFPESDFPGIDYVIPDYTHLVRNQHKIKALIITHGHEDHIGGVPFLLMKVHIPVIYAPRLAAGLIRHKLDEFRVREKVTIVEYDATTKLTLSPFKIEFFQVTHSIPDCFGIVFDTPNGRIVTTGDYKIDLTPVGPQAMDLARISELGKEGIDLLLADSTNAEQDGMSISESAVVSAMNDIFTQTKGRLIISTFSSNIHRIQQIVETAVTHNRKIIIFGRSMEKTVEIGRKLGYIHAPDANIIGNPETIRYIRPEELLILCTGSQGEPMAALSRIAAGLHKNVRIFPGDTVVFSSSPIPGNQGSVNRVINLLTRAGAEVLTNSIFTNIHASGHANRDELKFILTLAKPRHFMPMHGEYRMLKLHADIAVQLGMPREKTYLLGNGDTLLLGKGEVRMGKRVVADDIYVDGNDLSGLSTAVIHDRKILADDGVMAVMVSMNSRTNSLIAPISILTRGFMYFNGDNPLLIEAQKLLTTTLQDMLKGKVTFADIKNTIRTTLSSFIFSKTRRNPMIIPVVMNLKDPNASTESGPTTPRRRPQHTIA